MLHPGSPYVSKADWHIEQVEIRRYDKLDTTSGYREFLRKYPDSMYVMRRGDAGRTAHIDTYRPNAENDFFIEQYIDVPPGAEAHTLLRREQFEGRDVSVIRSTPLKRGPYAWREITVDRARWVPLKIDYFDDSATLQKTVALQWRQRFGIWYWSEAAFRNLQYGSATRITTPDIRINLDLPERDFLPHALERTTGK